MSTAQILGAITAAAVVLGLLPGAMPVQTSLSPDTSLSRGLFIELFATFQLVFTILMLAVEKHKGTYLAPLGIGLALFISELACKFPLFSLGQVHHTIVHSILFRYLADSLRQLYLLPAVH